MASCKEEREREPGFFVRQGSKLHSKMLSKEAAAQLAVPSFRVYYSVASAGAVPFMWESQPGTPKNNSASAAALPPLSPPPSYYAAKVGAGGRSTKRRCVAAILPRFIAFFRRPRHQTAPCSSWSTSSSSSSTMSPVFTVQTWSPAGGRHRRAFSADARCLFGMEPECCESGVAKGCSVVGAVRNVLTAVVGRRA